MKRLSLILLTLLFSVHFFSFGQVTPGCNDPQANNYNPDATINDGSCTYNPTIYSPELKFLLPETVEETSGLVYWDDALWTINDSGGGAKLYKLDTLTGNVIQEVTISDAQNVDWESLAQDDDHIYIGNFGNNSGTRDDLGIYIVKKDDIPASGNGSVTSKEITFVYEDYPEDPKRSRNHNFDCEAFISIEDSLYLFSKNREDEQTKMYRLPKTPGDYTAELISTYNVAGLVTGADYNEASREVTLVGYTNNTWLPFFWLLFDYHDNELFSGNKRRIDLLGIAASQTEAISYMLGKKGAITAEGNALFTQAAFDFSTGTWTDDTSTGIGMREAQGFDFVLSPNPVQKEKLTVFVESLPPGDYQIEVFDTSGRLMQIKDYKINTEKGSVKIRLKVGHLKAGLYFVRMRSGNTIVEKKFIKQ